MSALFRNVTANDLIQQKLLLKRYQGYYGSSKPEAYYWFIEERLTIQHNREFEWLFNPNGNYHTNQILRNNGIEFDGKKPEASSKKARDLYGIDFDGRCYETSLKFARDLFYPNFFH